MSRKESREERRDSFKDDISKMEKRRIKERHNSRQVWFGLGMMGVIGWTVALPTIGGLGLGIWLDSRFSGSISWTLTGLGGGIIAGCFMAWGWIKREQEDTDDDSY